MNGCDCVLIKLYLKTGKNHDFVFKLWLAYIRFLICIMYLPLTRLVLVEPIITLHLILLTYIWIRVSI